MKRGANKKCKTPNSQPTNDHNSSINHVTTMKVTVVSVCCRRQCESRLIATYKQSPPAMKKYNTTTRETVSMVACFNYTPGARGFTTGDTERRAVLDRDADAGLAGAGFEAEGCAACRVKEPRVLEVEVANASWRVKSLHFSRRVCKDRACSVKQN